MSTDSLPTSAAADAAIAQMAEHASPSRSTVQTAASVPSEGSATGASCCPGPQAVPTDSEQGAGEELHAGILPQLQPGRGCRDGDGP